MRIRAKRMRFLLLLLEFVAISGSLITGGAIMAAMTLTSLAFRNGELIPSTFTCDGADVNPALNISNVPTEAKSLALIVDDPDAPGGMWVHWVVWNIDPKTREIKENSVPRGVKQGVNDFRKTPYGGPCPPAGTHRYFFKLYALDTMLDLGPDTTKGALEKAMKGHVLAQAELMGKYKRK
jgi:Raf kinase inhibitor-like YbhB/YbcL family protein